MPIFSEIEETSSSILLDMSNGGEYFSIFYSLILLIFLLIILLIILLFVPTIYIIFYNKKWKKQFRHKAEIPLTVVSVILNVGILSLLAFLLIQIPENPDIKKAITDYFGINKDTVDAILHFGIYAVDILCVVLIAHVFLTYARLLGRCKGYDIKPDNVQMKEIKKFVDEYTDKLNLKKARSLLSTWR